MHNRFRFSLLILVVLLLSSSQVAFTDGLHLDFVLSEPDSLYFNPGDTLTATLIVTDDWDEELDVSDEDLGFLEMELWVSGPKQNYLMVLPYAPDTIVHRDGSFDESSGFNPETGEIEIISLDSVAEYGTYTVLFMGLS